MERKFWLGESEDMLREGGLEKKKGNKTRWQ
jgi:hypothetical protein